MCENIGYDTVERKNITLPAITRAGINKVESLAAVRRGVD
jgi:hypothetical protein